jgi:hypothetical protein
LAKSDALQKEIQADKVSQKKYALVRTPSPDNEKEKSIVSDDYEKKDKSEKKKKKKRDA